MYVSSEALRQRDTSEHRGRPACLIRWRWLAGVRLRVLWDNAGHRASEESATVCRCLLEQQRSQPATEELKSSVAVR